MRADSMTGQFEPPVLLGTRFAQDTDFDRFAEIRSLTVITDCPICV